MPTRVSRWGRSCRRSSRRQSPWICDPPLPNPCEIVIVCVRESESVADWTHDQLCSEVCVSRTLERRGRHEAELDASCVCRTREVPSYQH